MTVNRDLAPDAVSVTPLSPRVLRVRFANGELRDFDMVPLMERKCYQPLKSDTLFFAARVAYGTVQWPNGLDIDPEWLYEDSVPVDL
ncbi:MAG: DUF2442 domain-containing protein [bacterium]